MIDEDAKITAAGGAYAGLDRYEARKRVVEDLENLGLLDSIQDYTLSVGKCSRCKTVVEPLVSKQWFVKTKPLAAKAIAAVDEKRIEIIPENWVKTWNEWMHNIRDWCVSRQLWWGHRIPAWYCDACGETIVSRTDPASCAKCAGALRQDPDVLDTWFSSGLWPFSTLGWPDQTDDLKHFYPTTLLITGFDILFFWVARMSMLGIEFMGDVPFRQVYIHGLVRDAEKQKMSKTKGNVIDPLVVTEEYGTDAVRMALLTGAAPGTDIVFTVDRIDSARAFANKIWNAARFLFLNMERCDVEPWMAESVNGYLPDASAPVEDRWIFSRLNECARQMNRAIDQYRYHEAAQTVWHFIYDDFCDWYIELKKLRFVEGSGLNEDWRNLLAVFESALRLLASRDAVSHGRTLAPARRGRRCFHFARGFPAVRSGALRFRSRERSRCAAGRGHRGARHSRGSEPRSEAAARRAHLAAGGFPCGAAACRRDVSAWARCRRPGAVRSTAGFRSCHRCSARAARSAAKAAGKRARSADKEHRQLAAAARRRRFSEQGAAQRSSTRFAPSSPNMRRN